MHIIQLLLQMAAILLLGRLLTRVLRRVGQPSVIAEILAGIALGPSLLGWLWPEGLTLLFPATSLGNLGLVAQLGLVFFMFLVGLEFDPKLLQGQARTSVAISNAGIIVPFAMGAGLAVPLHGILAPEGVPLLPFALFLGTAMSVTAFPVLARILTERGLIRTKVGAIALAAAAVDDVTAWCLLALVVGIASAGGVSAAIITTVAALAYSAFVWFVVRPILARVGPRKGQALSTDVVGFVILLVILSAAATEWIGIHALFGAFLVGAAMPRESGLTAALAEKLEDFVSVVLLPLFFAYSGLRTEILLISQPSDWALCALVVGVATLGKFGGASIAGRLTGLNWRDASVLGILMNTRGLMELVVLNVGLDLGVISPRLFAMMVVMALVTTWIAGPLLAWLYPTGAIEPAKNEPAPARVGPLLCISDPATADSLVRVARVLAGDGEAEALYLRPTERPHDYLRGTPASDEPLEAIARVAAQVGLRYSPLAFASADPGGDIVRVAAMKGVPFVLLGVHRTTLGADSFGGVVARVMRESGPDVGVLVDRGVGELRTVALDASGGRHDATAGRVYERLLAAGLTPAAPTDADLVVRAWAPGASLPAEGARSCLFVRGST